MNARLHAASSSLHTLTMSRIPERRPGDILFDAIIPNASAEERERAHMALRELGRGLLSIAKEEAGASSRDSRNLGEGDRIEAPPHGL